MDVLKMVAAALALAGFAVAIVFMFSVVATNDDKQWTRYTYLYAGIEAVAFAAAGFLFGTQVNRERAKKAEDRAEKAEERVTGAENRATEATTKGKNIVELAETKLGTITTDTYGGLGEDAKGLAQDLTEVVAFGRRQFPR